MKSNLRTGIAIGIYACITIFLVISIVGLILIQFLINPITGFIITIILTILILITWFNITYKIEKRD